MAFSCPLTARSRSRAASRSSLAPSLRLLMSSAVANASSDAKTSSTASVPPAFEVGRDEGVVVQFGIGRIEPVDTRALARAQRFVRIETLDRGHEPLSPQDLMAAWNAAGKVMLDIEHD